MSSCDALALLSNVTKRAASTYDLTSKLAYGWLCVRDGVASFPFHVLECDARRRLHWRFAEG